MKDKKRFKKVLIATAAFSAALNLNACAYGPPANFDPSNNVNGSVYGPPVAYTQSTPDTPSRVDTQTDTNIDTDTEEFDPSDNLNVCVYGPPEYFEKDSE